MAEAAETITRSEITAMLVAAEMAELSRDAATIEAFQSYIADYMAGTLRTMEPFYFEQYKAAITGPADPQAIANARNLARRRAAEFARSGLKSELNKIGQVIADGIEAGDGPRQIARRLDNVKGLNPARARKVEKFRAYLETIDPPLSNDVLEARVERLRQKELKGRRETIARTEQRQATSEAQRVKADTTGARFKFWSTVGDKRVSRDICAPNEGQGWKPIKDAFQSGHQMTPGHPNCRCTILYRNFPPDKQDKARAERKSERTETALNPEVAA